MTQFLASLTGWVLFVSLVGATGSVVSRWLILPRLTLPGGTDGAWLRRGAARLGRAAGLLLIPAMALVLLRQVREFRDPFVPWTEDAVLLLSTSWGTTWKLAAVATLVVAAGFVLAAAGRRIGWWLATPFVLALAAFPGLTGHAGGGDGPTWLLLPADVLHVLAAGTWMGSLAVIL